MNSPSLTWCGQLAGSEEGELIEQGRCEPQEKAAGELGRDSRAQREQPSLGTAAAAGTELEAESHGVLYTWPPSPSLTHSNPTGASCAGPTQDWPQQQSVMECRGASSS